MASEVDAESCESNTASTNDAFLLEKVRHSVGSITSSCIGLLSAVV